MQGTKLIRYSILLSIILLLAGVGQGWAAPLAQDAVSTVSYPQEGSTVSGIVDIPNVCATVFLPTEIFEFDINPNANGPTKFIDGSVDIPISYWSDK